MPPRPTVPAAIASRFTQVRNLQTTAPLPPPTTSLPPVDPSLSASSTASSSRTPFTPSTLLATLPPLLPASTPEPSLPTTISSALDLMKSTSSPTTGIYINAKLHHRTYLLHPRDVLTLPTLQPMQPPGTTFKLTRILEVGTREYAIRSPAANAKKLRKYMPENDTRSLPTIPREIVSCELTVLEHTRSPQEIMIKKKRRAHYKKTIKQKNGWTRLRVGDIVLGEAPADAEGVTLEKL